MLELKNLNKAFGDNVAVSALTFSLQKGEVLGFLGQNGAGKSTTMRMISGVLEPDSGDAVLNGHSIVSERREAQSQIGYLPEGAPLYRDMTPLAFLRFIADTHGLNRSGRNDAVDRVIADARIADVANQSIGSLSKGYRRRVGLAAALVNDPPILLLDEPTDGLDPIQKRAVRALVARMAPTKAIVISTHTLEEVPAMCSRVLVINNGMMVADDTPQALENRKPGGLEEVFISLANSHEAGAK
ncbi:MAG: ABC transporter ATP-binding protein [Henriciella sp.]|nr:ABC transporter ATP-binding protein [Henriciella sp.]MBO6693846.1 ABC transporter ATP-binding protein [Henriciella sp.]